MPVSTRLSLCIAATAAFATPALAADCKTGLSVNFIESAPRDRFEIENTSQTATSVVSVQINLATSNGKLIFDTEDGGTGVEVYQPYREDSRDASLERQPVVADGAERLELAFENFPAKSRYSFSIDVDDQLVQSRLGQIRVAGSEMAGAEVTVVFAAADETEVRSTATFDARSSANICFDT